MYRFGLDFDRTRADAAPMRVDNANNVGESFDWKKPGLRARPTCRSPSTSSSKPCAIGGGDVLDAESATAHESDLADLEELADRFGIPIGDGEAARAVPQAGLGAEGPRPPASASPRVTSVSVKAVSSSRSLSPPPRDSTSKSASASSARSSTSRSAFFA